MRVSLERKILLAFGITLAALAIMVGGAWWSINRFETTFRWVDHTHQVLYELEALLTHVQTVQIESQRYVLTGDEACIERWEAGGRQTRASIARLDELTHDNPIQQRHLQQIAPLFESAMTITRDRIDLRKQGGLTAALGEVAKGRVRRVVDGITTLIQAAETDERQLLAARTSETQAAGVSILAITVGSSVVAALLGGVGLFVTIRDLTARRKAEAELDRFFTLTHDLLCIAGFDGYFKRLNPAWTKVLGYSTEELLATPYVEFLHPADREKTEAQAERQAGGHEAVSFENRYRCKDGSYRWLQWNARPIQEDGLIFATARDITDRKRVEQIHLEFRSLFESLPGLYLVLTPDLKIVAVSDAYTKATLTRRADLLGRGLFDAFPDNPDDTTANGVSNLRSSLQRVIETSKTDTMAIQRYDIRRPDGTFEERFWSPINSPVLGADRQLEYIIHRVEDVTEFIRKKTATGTNPDLQNKVDLMEAEIFQSSQKVQAANDQLHAVNAELEAFTYSVSHDLRAPLRHIDGFANLLHKHAGATLDDKSRRYVDVISEAAKKMGRLIDDLLAFSRTGRTQMRQTVVNQDELVASVIAEGRFDQSGKPIEWKIAPLPAVHADAAMLKQVWSNLIDNAVKYSGKVEHPRVEIGVAPAGAAGEVVCFVRDNGAGFDMRYVEKLFGVFQRLHTEAEFQGTGIGLANIRRIVTRHGGRTWAEGELGAGATFYFSLPVSETSPSSPS